MKPATLLVSALAGLVAAAPAEKRTSFDLSQLNGLNSFNQLNLNYLLNINQLNLQLLGELGSANNFNVLSFQNLFQSNSFDLQSLLELQQLQMLLQFQSLGLFSGFDLSGLQLASVQLGLINNVGGVDLSQFIQPGAIGQIQAIAGQVPGAPGI